MRRIAVVAGAVILVVGMIGAGLAVASRRSGIVRHQVLRFAVQLVNEDTVDVGASGDSPGDTFIGQRPPMRPSSASLMGTSRTSAPSPRRQESRWNACSSHSGSKAATDEGGAMGRFEGREGSRSSLSPRQPCSSTPMLRWRSFPTAMSLATPAV
jgi:hypothetical protein